MGGFRKLVKNVLPYYFVKKYQARNEGNPFEPGGYYSPIPSIEEIKRFNFDCSLPDSLPGIDFKNV